MRGAETPSIDGRLAAYRRAAARADRPLAPTAGRLARHAEAAAWLAGAGEPTLARGARVVTGVVSLRLAATPATSARDWAMKWPTCFGASRLLEPERRERVGRLLEHARGLEIDARLSAWLAVGPADVGDVVPPGAPDRTPTLDDPPPLDRARYARAAAMDADLTTAIAHADLVIRDMARLARSAPDLATGARAELEDVALALCARTPLSAWDAEDQDRFLDILADALPHRPATVAMVRVATEAEWRRWGEGFSGFA